MERDQADEQVGDEVMRGQERLAHGGIVAAPGGQRQAEEFDAIFAEHRGDIAEQRLGEQQDVEGAMGRAGQAGGSRPG